MSKIIDSIKTLNTTQSISVDSGSLVVSGGAGIAKNLNIGGLMTGKIRTVTTDATLDSDYILNVNNPASMTVRLPDITDTTYDGVEYTVIKKHDNTTEFLATETQKITASDAVGNESFGWSCAIYADTMVVGSRADDLSGTDEGSAFVFIRTGTTWTEQAKLTASDGANSDFFGEWCSIYENTAIVGVPTDNLSGSDEGSVYVFTRSGETWTQEAKLTASDFAGGDYFGFRCAVYKDTILVSNPRDEPPGSNSGSAYIFTRSGTTWTQIQKFTASDAVGSERFGESCAMYEDTIVIGTYRDDDTFTNAGSAFIFTRSGTTWTQIQKLTADDGTNSDEFGVSCSLYEDTVVIGAWLDDLDASRTDAGSAYIFTRSGTTWSFQQKLTASDGSTSDQFGRSCSIYGDTVVIGANLDDVTSSNEGSVYIYTRSGTTWINVQKISASDFSNAGQFGYSCAIYENTVAVGETYDNEVASNAGAAYIFDIQPAGDNVVSILADIKETQKITASDGGSDQFGYSCSIHQDTLVIGARNDDLAGTNEGSAYIFTRSGTTWTEQAKLTASDKTDGENFGQSCGVYEDTVVVGAYLKDVPTNQEGAAYVYTRSDGVWTEIQKLTASDAETGDRFGISCAIYEDTIAVGAYLEHAGGLGDAGSVYVFTRSGTTWSEIQKITASDKVGFDRFGESCAIYEDSLVVGSNLSNNDVDDEGAAYIFTRSGTTWTEQAKLTASDKSDNDFFGKFCSIYEDTVVIGSYFDDVAPAGADEGSAYIYERSGTTWTQQAKLTASDKTDADNFGRSCSIYKDTVVVGNYLDDIISNNSGSVYVYTRSGTTWTNIQKITASDIGSNDQYGISCSIYEDTVVVGSVLESAGYIYDIQRIAGPPDVSRITLEDEGDRVNILSNGNKWYLM